jgi:PAS domain S-box-containing protein
LQGYAAMEVTGHSIARLLAPADDAQTVVEERLHTASTEGHFEAYDWVYHRDGSRFWGHSLITPLRDRSGHMLGFACLIHDLSEIRKAQELQENLNTELEHRVQERTQQLEAANAELESFSYTVSHDLRSPLRHINHYIELGREAAGQGHAQDFVPCLDQMDNSVRNMGHLIDGLLDLARLGRTALHEMPIQMGGIVAEALQAVSGEAKARHIDWVVAQDFPLVQCDPILMRQVWSNLLSNAIKYSRTREFTRIEVAWCLESPGVGRFHVADNGVGFDPRFRDKLFGMFQRLHSATEFEGTGIGLALTRKIVERHGGTIGATGEKDVGCTIHFTLPLATS